MDGAHDLPPRHRTLRAAIGYSYALLDEEERALFRSLGVFEGGCDLQAIEAVSAWGQKTASRPLLPMLHALVRKSLVRAEATPDGSTRFLLLETIRDFALERVRAEGEEDVLRERHYNAYLQLFRTGDRCLRGPESRAWLARLEPEEDNLRAALQWTLDASQYSDMAWLLEAVSWYWFQTGHWYETAQWLGRLLPHRQALPADLRLATLISFHAVARTFEEFGSIQPYTAEMMEFLEACPNKGLQATAWHFIAGGSHDLSEACAGFEQAIASARVAREGPHLGARFGTASDPDFTLGLSLWAYADLLIEHGQFAEAVPLLAENATIFQAHGNRYELAPGLGTSGRMALLQGDLKEARARLQAAISLALAFEYQEQVGKFLPLLGIVTLYEGDFAEARRLLGDSLRRCLDLNDRFYLARVCVYLAEVALSEVGLEEAEQWLAESFAYNANPLWSSILPVERVLVAARIATAQGAYLRAATLFGAANRACSQLGYQPVGPIGQLADAALAAVVMALDPARFAGAFGAGEEMSLGEALGPLLARSSIPSLSPVASTLS